MALLLFDGFDHYGNSQNPATMGKWGALSGTFSTQVGGRTGTYAMRGTTVPVMTTKAYTTSGGAVVGMAFLSVGFSAGDVIQVLEGATVHVAVAVTAGGLVTVKRGATVLATGTTVLVINNWYYLELKAVIHDSAGSYEVRIDGVVEAALTASGVDTRNAGTGVWDRVAITCGSGSQHWFDDFYLCDTSGAAPRNTFLGPVKVETILPQTDAVAAGSNAGLTPSTGTDHGALVDEAGPNTTDYNSSPTVGAKDTYQYPSLSLTGTILGVQVIPNVSKSDAAVRQVCAVLRAGGTDYDGPNVSPTTSFLYYTALWAQNPNTSADWTSGEIDTLQAGMKVTA